MDEMGNDKYDIEYVKEYLKNVINLEIQRRTAERMLGELGKQENNWKKKTEFVAVKRKPQIYASDIVSIVLQGAKIWLAITVLILIVSEVLRNSSMIQLLCILVWLISPVVLMVIRPIVAKKKDMDGIKEGYIKSVQYEKSIKQQGQNALYVIDDNRMKLQNALQNIKSNLRNAYAANIIYKKYQTVEACCAILEYLDSGRCYSLQGPYGAYNKYEDDVMNGRIISSLDRISLQLGAILAGQEVLQHTISQIERNVDVMQGDINTICNSLQGTQTALNRIADNTRITAWASSVSAINSREWSDEAERRARKIYYQ